MKPVNWMLLGWLLLSFGCASAPPGGQEPSRAFRRGASSAQVSTGGHMLLGGVGIQPVAGRMILSAKPDADAFELLLLRAGLESHLSDPRRELVSPEDAERLLASLLVAPVTLGNFPPRMAASYMLREVLDSSGVSRAELMRRMRRFEQVAVLRPDGCLAWVLSGQTQQRVGPMQWRDGAFRAHLFEMGRFYSGRGGVFRLLDSSLKETAGDAFTEVHDDADYVSRSLDGVEAATLDIARSIGHLLSTPPADSVAALRHLPAALAALLTSSPAYLERFRYMPRGEQVQVLSRWVTSLIATWGTATTTARALRGTAHLGAEVPVLSLSANGLLMMERVVVPLGSVGSVLSGAPGAVVILHRTVTGASGSAPAQGPGRWGPAHEAMSPRARRYQEQISGHSADEAYWVGGVNGQQGVKFDGFDGGVLLEAKGPGYADKFQVNLEPKLWFKDSGAQALLEQASRQLNAAKGTPIRWHVAEEKTANAIRKLFDADELDGIEVVFTPPLP